MTVLAPPPDADATLRLPPDADATLRLPVDAPRSERPALPLVVRLVSEFEATWVDADTVGLWSTLGGDRVMLLAGDPVRFPEGLDVAAVLPELRRAVPTGFHIGVVARDAEDALAARYGVQRWPTLLFLRDGGYVGSLAGMHDWDDFVAKVRGVLAGPVVPAPARVIVLASASTADAGCR